MNNTLEHYSIDKEREIKDHAFHITAGKTLKKYKNIIHYLCVCAIISVDILLRCFLARNNWPLPNSDEATMGIMSMHILRGAHPIFFYGQTYMGAFEAYVGAFFFQLFGASIFSLRLGLVLVFTLFLLSMYLLTCKLYSRTFAIFTLLILSLGPNADLSRQLMALGGYVETLFFTAAILLLTYHLALSPSPAHPLKRLFLYGCWGLVIGLALWSDLLILPWVVGASILLLVFCWRELLKGPLLLLLFCLTLGALPLIIYNIRTTPDQNSWVILLSQQGSEPLTFSVVSQQIKNTLEVSVPMITGNPFCHLDETPDLKILGFETPHPETFQCHAFGASWSVIYLVLLAISAMWILFSLKKALHTRYHAHYREVIVKNALQITMLFCAILVILIFIHSVASFKAKAENTRYLICLWVTAPLALWPLWRGMVHARSLLKRQVFIQTGKILAYLSIIFIILAIFLYGTVKTVQEVPQARAANVQENQLIQGLLQHHITHIYSDYWTCDRIVFQSHEQIICEVLTLTLTCSLQPGSHNRYPPYSTIVSADPDSSYLLLTSMGCNQQADLKMHQEGRRYQVFTLNDYTVYQPTSH